MTPKNRANALFLTNREEDKPIAKPQSSQYRKLCIINYSAYISYPMKNKNLYPIFCFINLYHKP